MGAIARTATGQEGCLLIASNGALVTSASMMFGEMRMFLIPPEEPGWVLLDGSDVDTNRYPRLAGRIKKLPKLEYTWVYVG